MKNNLINVILHQEKNNNLGGMTNFSPIIVFSGEPFLLEALSLKLMNIGINDDLEVIEDNHEVYGWSVSTYKDEWEKEERIRQIIISYINRGWLNAYNDSFPNFLRDFDQDENEHSQDLVLGLRG